MNSFSFRQGSHGEGSGRGSGRGSGSGSGSGSGGLEDTSAPRLPPLQLQEQQQQPPTPASSFRQYQRHNPSGHDLFDSYRADVINNFQRERPRYNPMNPDRPQSSMLVDLKDPIQVHLLTETALADSKEYEILSQEEVDDLKKQCQALVQRVDQTRANLAIQSKYRDAAISMSKLYSPTRTDSRRKSLLGRHVSGGDNAKEAEHEKQASERKCEELSSELWSLEKRLMEPQRRLLQHTAGILQLTHREEKRKSRPPTGQRQPVNSGMPGSPESMYTYSNSRNSYENPNAEIFFDQDNDPYASIDDNFENWGRSQSINTAATSRNIEPPVKSPIRQQTRELRMEADKLKEDNDTLNQQNLSLNSQVQSLEREGSQRMRTIEETEQKLEDLNTRLRDIIVQINPMKNRGQAAPPSGANNGLEPGDTIPSQLEYLERGLTKIEDDQETQTREVARQAELQVETLNKQIREVILSTEPGYPMPPGATGSAALDDQCEYLQNAIVAVQGQISQAAATAERSNASFAAADADRQRSEQSEATLTGLWDVIQSGLADAAQRKQKVRSARVAQGLGVEDLDDGDSDISADEGYDPAETYSMQAFSSKVQWLSTQTVSLKEQKSVLKRQIKQQRELNSKSDSEREVLVQEKNDEIMATKNMLAEAAVETNQVRAELERALKEVEGERRRVGEIEVESREAVAKAASAGAATAAADAAAKARKDAEEKVKESLDRISELEIQGKELGTRLKAKEQEVADLEKQLQAASKAREEAEAGKGEAEKAIKGKEEEFDSLNMMIVELKTELTIAQAELDGAYGSRAERAKDVAKIASTAEVQDLKDRVAELEAELMGTVSELESITKETISQEREKLELEGKLDDAVHVRGELERDVGELRDRLDQEVSEGRERVGKLKEELDKERLKVPSGGEGKGDAKGVAGGGKFAGASMLSEQFRTTMREERKKFQEDLRKEMSERRKIEDELRQLKKQVGPGKSPLSPRP